MPILAEVVISALIVIGAVFLLVGSWGMIRMPELMTRLHAPTKATTLGVGGALLASIAYFLAAEGRFSVHELLISMFLFLSAPITAHFLAKAHMHSRLSAALLPKPEGKGWSTYDKSDAAESADASAREPS
ncbi:MAG: Na+/H+ antiporter subunit G [Betaproteobacteria bacterium HGW-Betaproteobacteria-13]|jgi:multicomponent K+:H+ antiporter subunit G|uniref:Na+/H+ antiporter subunit G n=1 Tax=Parazoarcus communis TaxID=41977 RepID=A0A2U8H2K7_9RHOO|nr:Na+/H+ antiporter subunit G [Parazoarcus communis]AWI79803.1 Na+/H+ antiporter subunit G [Parazoarcus communis]PKO81410.1 MAG: Na+/H+ antiporter subunit G [Betaproteobacteria bacterium HGW-Betaproteobacteria-13]